MERIRTATVTLAMAALILDRAVAVPTAAPEQRAGAAQEPRSPAVDEFLLDRVEPRHDGFHRLKAALQRYRRIAQSGGWPSVPNVWLRPADGAPHEHADDGATSLSPLEAARYRRALVAVCERLQISGDLRRSDRRGCDDLLEYDSPLQQAVRRFQARTGLATDGIVGPRTRAAMNVPVEERLAQMAANLARWWRLPDDLGERFVMVNIAAYRLTAVAAGRPVLSMRVIAGRPETPTPVFRDEISYLVFGPYWNVPRSITERELLPRIAANPAYLRRQRLQVVDGWSAPAKVIDPETIDWDAALDAFPFRLRQRPGPRNALGLVKFMFPNRFNVYLHDTPARHLFAVGRRAFSHGCVRVEAPIALARFLLADPERWTEKTVETAMHAGRRRVVHLAEPVPVYLTYFTAWVDDGVVQFREDIYRKDADA